ncbi:SseB family protein [Microbacterium binotii]|uniref:SseB family protein n=1 Tax=Microbacterium binotii TaxID=462710 RepID=UPI001F422E3C|nr:SseB family protein [Microbacterium binotii]UIN31981.1 SseB family protein [Microbacterium binotii]
MSENTRDALVRELDLRKAAFRSAAGNTEAEMAVWEAAAKLPDWFIVNRGTPEKPMPGGFSFDEVGTLIGVYSTAERAVEAAGADATLVAAPLPEALDWLASFAQSGVAGIVLDSPGPWTSLSNLRFFRQWIPQEREAADAVVIAPRVQAAADAYMAGQNDETYGAVVREIANAELFVVLDPAGDGSTPASIVNGRGERILLAFTDSERVDAIYAGKEITVVPRSGREVLRLIGDAFDVLVVDPQHPSSIALTPEWIGDELR